jgi:hypothetical protein
MADTNAAPPKVPHYMLPNFTSILPEYSNAEQDKIREAFSTGNYSAVSKMPNSIGPETINKSRQEQIDSNRKANPFAAAGKKVLGMNTGTFSDYDYMPSRYSLADELASKERVEMESKRQEIGGKDFICSSNHSRLKHEDGFEDKTYRYPYMSEPFEAAQEQMMRVKWLEDSKVLHGPFVPSGGSRFSSADKTLDTPTRTILPQIVEEIHKILADDWMDNEFSVLATEEDTIIARFKLDTIDSEKGLVAYMNVMSRDHPVICKYRLVRIVEDWDTKPGDGFLHFTFRPPWVKARTVDTYYTLHPEQRLFRPGN